LGPAWQLIAGLGAPSLASQRIAFSGSYEYRSDVTFRASCPVRDGFRVVTVSRGSGSSDAGTQDVLMPGMARLELAADLSTYALLAAAQATEPTENTEVTTTILSRCPDSDAQSGTVQNTRQPQLGVQLNLRDLPLPGGPGVITGSATVPMRFDGVDEIDVDVQWTLRPIP
jgi:hypothetical protein